MYSSRLSIFTAMVMLLSCLPHSLRGDVAVGESEGFAIDTRGMGTTVFGESEGFTIDTRGMGTAVFGESESFVIDTRSEETPTLLSALLNDLLGIASGTLDLDRNDDGVLDAADLQRVIMGDP